MSNTLAAQREKKRRQIEAARQRLDNDVLDRGEDPIRMSHIANDWRDDVHPNYFRDRKVTVAQPKVEKGRRAVRQSEIDNKPKPTPVEAWAEYNSQRRAKGLGDDPDSPQFKAEQAWKVAAENRGSSQRMASDAIPEGLDDLIGEIRDEGSANTQQTNYLAKQLGRFAEIDSSFERAGVPHQEVLDLQTQRQLANGVPAPYIDTINKPGIERRVHVGVGMNPYTNEREIVPFRNPETMETLVTEFGDGRDGRIDDLNIPNNQREVGDRASELLGKHIMWLKGDRDARIAVNGNNFARPDMDAGDGRGIDIHTLRTGVHDNDVEIQVNTGLNPTISPRGSSNRAVQQMIEGRLDQGENIFEAIDNLKSMSRGGVSPILYKGKDVSAGKLVKEGYDGLISPMFDRSEALLNVYNRLGKGNQRLQPNMQDKSVIKPERIFEIDLHKVRDSVSSMSPAQQKSIMRVTPNKGNRGDGMERSRVNVNVPHNTPGVVDISNKGYVAQLMKHLQYEQ